MHGLAASLSLAVLVAASSGWAQPVERNLPPAPSAVAPMVIAPEASSPSGDATPIGPALRAVVLLNARDPVQPTARDGVDVSRTPRLIHQGKAFSRFLGRRISARLIAQLEAEVTRRYRAAGFPFVSVSVPEQEITAGVVQLRVVEFHLGAKSAPGASPADAPYLESRIRVSPGDAIAAAPLAQDLDWLDRYPFRRIEAVMAPGAAFGTTDLRLQTTPLRPYSLYAGYANSGSPLTGWDRYFAGFESAIPGWRDALAAYQFTGSGDLLFGDGAVFRGAADPRYVSQAGRLILPTLPRQDVEASFSFVQSNQASPPFTIRQTTYEGVLAYRGALSNLWPALPGDAAIGVELKRQDSDVLFGDAKATSRSIDVFQITFAYAGRETDAFGDTSGEASLHFSPGSINRLNTDGAFSAFSQGRSDTSTYAYVSGDLNRYTRLPSLFQRSGWAMINSLIGQYSAVALPTTEQTGLGGEGLARGYSLDDGAFDTSLVSRNELRAPPMKVLPAAGRWSDSLSPFAFLDAGYGADQRRHAGITAVSMGLGGAYQLGAHLSASFDAAWALTSVGLTHGGDARLESRATVAF